MRILGSLRASLTTCAVVLSPSASSLPSQKTSSVTRSDSHGGHLNQPGLPRDHSSCRAASHFGRPRNVNVSPFGTGQRDDVEIARTRGISDRRRSLDLAAAIEATSTRPVYRTPRERGFPPGETDPSKHALVTGPTSCFRRAHEQAPASASLVAERGTRRKGRELGTGENDALRRPVRGWRRPQNLPSVR